MKARIITALALSAALLTLAACSFITDFVVINESAAPVEVQVRYRLKGSPPAEFASAAGRPAVKAADDVADSDAPWRDLSAGEFAYDRAAGAVTVVLPPAHGLRVAREGDYGAFGDGTFDIEALTVSGADGSACFEGLQAERQFVYQSMNLHTFTYLGRGGERE